MGRSRWQGLWSRVRRLVSYDEILVLGDSHSAVFNNPLIAESFPGRYFDIVMVAGATVSGLKNPNSKTQAMPTFLARLGESTAEKTIVLLGEVDVGFVIWYRAQKYESSVDDMFERAVSNYQDFLLKVREKSEVICISCPLPTITDDNIWAEIANARKEVKATQIERTELTLRFNRRMCDFCESESGVEYVDLDSESLGEDGLVRAELLNANPSNHHYEDDVYARMLFERLDPLLS